MSRQFFLIIFFFLALGIAAVLEATDKNSSLLAFLERKDSISDDAEGDFNLNVRRIESGSIEMRVNDYHRAYNEIQTVLNKYGATLLAESAVSRDNLLKNTLSISVRASDFQRFIDEIDALSAEVIQRSNTPQDISEQMLEIEARLSSKNKALAELSERLMASKSERASILLHREEIEEDIAVLEARRQFWEHQAEVCKVQVVFYENISISEAQNMSYGQKISKAMSTGLNNSANLLVAAMGYWPLLLLGLLGVVFGVGYMQRSRKEMKAWLKQEMLLMQVRQGKSGATSSATAQQNNTNRAL